MRELHELHLAYASTRIMTSAVLSDTGLHERGLDPDDDRIRLSQLFINGTPFPSLSDDSQRHVIGNFIHGNIPFRAVFHLNTKTSRCIY